MPNRAVKVNHMSVHLDKSKVLRDNSAQGTQTGQQKLMSGGGVIAAPLAGQVKQAVGRSNNFGKQPNLFAVGSDKPAQPTHYHPQRLRNKRSNQFTSTAVSSKNQHVQQIQLGINHATSDPARKKTGPFLQKDSPQKTITAPSVTQSPKVSSSGNSVKASKQIKQIFGVERRIKNSEHILKQYYKQIDQVAPKIGGSHARIASGKQAKRKQAVSTPTSQTPVQPRKKKVDFDKAGKHSLRTKVFDHQSKKPSIIRGPSPTSSDKPNPVAQQEILLDREIEKLVQSDTFQKEEQRIQDIISANIQQQKLEAIAHEEEMYQNYYARASQATDQQSGAIGGHKQTERGSRAIDEVGKHLIEEHKKEYDSGEGADIQEFDDFNEFEAQEQVRQCINLLSSDFSNLDSKLLSEGEENIVPTGRYSKATSNQSENLTDDDDLQECFSNKIELDMINQNMHQFNKKGTGLDDSILRYQSVQVHDGIKLGSQKFMLGSTGEVRSKENTQPQLRGISNFVPRRGGRGKDIQLDDKADNTEPMRYPHQIEKSDFERRYKLDGHLRSLAKSDIIDPENFDIDMEDDPNQEYEDLDTVKVDFVNDNQEFDELRQEKKEIKDYQKYLNADVIGQKRRNQAFIQKPEDKTQSADGSRDSVTDIKTKNLIHNSSFVSHHLKKKGKKLSKKELQPSGFVDQSQTLTLDEDRLQVATESFTINIKDLDSFIGNSDKKMKTETKDSNLDAQKQLPKLMVTQQQQKFQFMNTQKNLNIPQIFKLAPESENYASVQEESKVHKSNEKKAQLMSNDKIFTLQHLNKQSREPASRMRPFRGNQTGVLSVASVDRVNHNRLLANRSAVRQTEAASVSRLNQPQNLIGVPPSNITSKPGLISNYGNLSQSAFTKKRGSINLVKDSSSNQGVHFPASGPNRAYQVSGSKKRYQMDNKSTKPDFTIVGKDIKFITVNMLNVNLTRINIKNNKILYLPDEICELSNLKELDASGNQLQELPNGFRALRQLQILKVSNNSLRTLPNELCYCKALIELELGSNKLKELPIDIGNCADLQNLQIHENEIFMLPSSLKLLQKLKTMHFEWFQYFDPPQQVNQTGSLGECVINMLREFLENDIHVDWENSFEDYKQIEGKEVIKGQKTFIEFILYIHVFNPSKVRVLLAEQVVEEFNQLNCKNRRLPILQVCQYSHLHLLQELLDSKSGSKLSNLINSFINLNHSKVCSKAFSQCLKQKSAVYALMFINSKTLFQMDFLSLSQQSFPLLIHAVQNNLEVALKLLLMGPERVNPHITTQINANIIHLLFFNYHNDAHVAKQILRECIRQQVDVNHIDQEQAAPIHIAIRKRQHQVIRDIVEINKTYRRPVFNLNIMDKRGRTPLHFAVDQQDLDLFIELMRDPYIDPDVVDSQEYLKPRRCSVIFSAYYKILYTREKMKMRRAFNEDIQKNYTDFEKASTTNYKTQGQTRPRPFKQPAPISVSNKARKSMDFSNEALLMIDRNVQPAHSKFMDFSEVEDHKEFYKYLQDRQECFVDHSILTVKELRKAKAQKAAVKKPELEFIPDADGDEEDQIAIHPIINRAGFKKKASDALQRAPMPSTLPQKNPLSNQTKDLALNVSGRKIPRSPNDRVQTSDKKFKFDFQEINSSGSGHREPAQTQNIHMKMTRSLSLMSQASAKNSAMVAQEGLPGRKRSAANNIFNSYKSAAKNADSQALPRKQGSAAIQRKERRAPQASKNNKMEPKTKPPQNQPFGPYFMANVFEYAENHNRAEDEQIDDLQYDLQLSDDEVGIENQLEMNLKNQEANHLKFHTRHKNGPTNLLNRKPIVSRQHPLDQMAKELINLSDEIMDDHPRIQIHKHLHVNPKSSKFPNQQWP